MGEQRILDVRFPMGSDGGILTPTWNVLHWTNHPECVKRTWFEEIPNPPAEGAERWYHFSWDWAAVFGTEFFGPDNRIDRIQLVSISVG